MKFVKAMSACALALAASGCASIIRGTSQDFTVQSTPVGARAALSTGEVCEATPCTLRRSRNEVFSVTVTHPGYEPQTQEIRNPWSRNGTTTGIVGNAILGGGIGIGIDAATGANRDLTPNPLVVTLVPVSTATVAATTPAAPEATATPVTVTPEAGAVMPTSAAAPAH